MEVHLTEPPASGLLGSGKTAELIHEDWQTHETRTADADGRIFFTGFKGDYTLETAGGRGTIALTADLETQVRLG